MGLPSGNRWAVSNLDAIGPYYFQETPFQYECSFFSWGNVTPHNPISKAAFDYDFGGNNAASPWYEGQPYGDTPGSTLTGDIPLNMDAARKMLGQPWLIPSIADYEELLAYTIFIDADGNEVDTTKSDKRVSVNGVMGIYIQSKLNGARMFFPCTGRGGGRSWVLSGISGYYWSRTYNSVRYARRLYFANTGVATARFEFRHFGFALRPLWKPSDLR